MRDVLYTKFMSNGACNGTAFKRRPVSGIMHIIRSSGQRFSHQDMMMRLYVGVCAYMCSEPWCILAVGAE